MNTDEKRIYDFVREELKDEMIPISYRGLIDSKYCGHCHHASLAMYNLLGGKTNGYKLQTATDELEIKHYWLVNSKGEIIDPTIEQYTDLDRKPPYDKIANNRASHRKTKATKLIIENVTKKLQSSA